MVIFSGFAGDLRFASLNTTFGTLPCLALFDCVLGPWWEGFLMAPCVDLEQQRQAWGRKGCEATVLQKCNQSQFC